MRCGVDGQRTSTDTVNPGSTVGIPLPSRHALLDPCVEDEPMFIQSSTWPPSAPSHAIPSSTHSIIDSRKKKNPSTSGLLPVSEISSLSSASWLGRIASPTRRFPCWSLMLTDEVCKEARNQTVHDQRQVRGSNSAIIPHCGDRPGVHSLCCESAYTRHHNTS